MKKEQCERSVSFRCTSSFSRFLCLSWWPAGLTSCLPLPLNLVGQRGNGRCMSERESEYIVVIGGGYSGDGLTGVGGFCELSWTPLILIPLGVWWGHSSVHDVQCQVGKKKSAKWSQIPDLHYTATGVHSPSRPHFKPSIRKILKRDGKVIFFCLQSWSGYIMHQSYK